MPAVASADYLLIDPSTFPGVIPVVRLAGEGLYLDVSWNYSSAPSNIVSVVWDPAGDNQAFTLVKSGALAALNIRTATYFLPNPATAKSGNVAVTFDGSSVWYQMIEVRHITGHDTAQGVRSSAIFSGSIGSGSTPISNSLSSVAGDIVMDSMTVRDDSTLLDAVAGQTNVQKHANGTTHALLGSSKAGSATVAMGWSSGDTNAAFAYTQVISSIVAAAATVPNAPTIGAATVTGATSASVNGTAPANNGGSPITGYRATSTPGSITATSATLPVTVPGLTTGTAYTFRLEAQNSVGYSSQSAASNSVTPATGNQAPAFGGTYANVSGTIGTPLSAPAATSYFTDTDTLTYSASPAGTAWPAGVTCNATTGQPTGTPTGSAATTTGCKIRASDGSLATDSNSFNFVIGAASGNKTYTSTKAMKRVNGTVAAGVSLKAIVSLLDGTYLDTKPGVVTNSSGVPAPFTSTFGTAGTPTRIVWIEESAPTNPAPTENVTPT